MSDRNIFSEEIELLDDDSDSFEGDEALSDDEREYEEAQIIPEQRAPRRNESVAVFDRSEFDRRMESEETDYRHVKGRQNFMMRRLNDINKAKFKGSP